MTGGQGPGEGVHATAVLYGESGVLILGPSGSGKSALALALIAHARAAGQYGALIGDDRVWLRAAGGRLVASGAPHMAGLIERRGVGLLTATNEPAAVIRLVVELNRPGESWPRWPREPGDAALAGVLTPRLALNAAGAAADHALSVVERLGAIRAERGEGRRFSLEQCAAVHKNRKLASLRKGFNDVRSPRPDE